MKEIISRENTHLNDTMKITLTKKDNQEITENKCIKKEDQEREIIITTTTITIITLLINLIKINTLTLLK
jgi:hypothetical protein